MHLVARDLSDAEIEDLVRQVAAAPGVEPPAELIPLEPGAVVGDAYRIEARIGQGGMGVVYRATDIALGRPVALKLHRRRPAEDGLDRLMREASVMAQLSHPHVLTVFEVGSQQVRQGEPARLFIAMEYVDGGSVVSWANDEHPDWRAILEVFLQAGDGLAAAHEAGVVHRDFKPDNVLIDGDGRVRVADFGLARLGVDHITVGSEERPPPSGDKQTDIGSVIGTPAYMAPEQWEGKAVTAASDQYAFCVSLFELLYGRNPLAEQRANQATTLAWTAPAGSRVPKRILRTLRRGLAPAPADRFARMQDLLAALRHDPWRGPIRLAGVVAVVGVSSALAWTAASDPSPGCDAEAEIAAVWNDDSREALRTALNGEGLPYGETTVATVTSMLDRHAQAWAEEANAACRGPDEPTRAARQACLRSDRRRFAALIDALRRADAKGRERAVGATSELPSPADCAAAVLPSDGDDALDRAAREALDEQLVAAAAAVALSDKDGAETLLEALRPAIENTGAPDLRAQLELTAARFAQQHLDASAAVQALDRALEASLQASDPRLSAKVATELAHELVTQGRMDEAERAVLIADSVAERAAPPIRLRIRLISARVSLAVGREEFEKAAELAKAGAELAQAELGDDPVTATMLNNLSVPLYRLQRHDEALAANLRALEITRAIQGEGHPRMARSLYGRGALLSMAGRPEEALEPLRRSLDIYRATAGPTARPTIDVAAHLASALLIIVSDRGTRGEEVAQAKAVLEPIAERLEQEGRQDEPGHEVFWDNYASVAIKDGRPEDALAILERVVASLEKSVGPSSTRLVPALTKIVGAQLDLERYDEARATAERCVTIAIASKSAPLRIARTHLLLGEAEHAAGNLEAAREALEQGRDWAERGGSETLVQRAEARLAKLDAPGN